MGLFGMSAVAFAKNPSALKAEIELATRMANKLTKAELLAANPGGGLQKYTKADLVTRAIALHIQKWEAEQEVA